MTYSEQQIVKAEKDRPDSIYAVQQLCYSYPFSDSFALKDITFSINRGETVGVVGESGSGKSTLLYSLSGMIPHFYRGGQYSGNVELQGENINNIPLIEAMRQVAIVFQDPSTQTFGLKVTDALAFGMENLAIPKDEMYERISEVTEKLNLSDLLERDTMTLSGGQRQAVAIASMLAMSPQIMLFDEVISALDTRGQETIKGIIQALHEEGKSLIIVDSDLDWLSSNVDRLLVLNNGTLTYDGPPQKTRPSLRVRPNFKETIHSENIVEVKGLTFSYNDGPTALENINLGIKKGACTALVGANGSGKSTLAQLIAGLLRPTKGLIQLSGKELYSLKAHEAVRHVGYLYQYPAAMFMTQSVEEELIFTPQQIKEHPAVTLGDLALSEFARRSPWDLSSGQQQRLAIGCALSVSPEVIILDEPTLGQTRKDRENINKLIEDLQQKGHTIVLISHDLEFVAKSAQEVHVLDKGVLVESGSARRVFEKDELFDRIGIPLPWSKKHIYGS